MQSNTLIDPSLQQNPGTSPAKSLAPSQNRPSHYQDAAYSPIQPSPQNNSYPNVQTPNYYPRPGQDRQSTQGSPSQHSPSTQPSHNPEDLKRPRACEACRQLKVKCEIEDDSPDGSCKRCAKAHRQCIITVPSRKRQKKTDSRVAELEKKIDALTATLAAQGGHPEQDAALDPAIARPDRFHQSNLYAPQWQGQQSADVLTPPNSVQIARAKRKSSDHHIAYDADASQSRSAVKLERRGPYADAKLSRTNSETISKDIVDRGLIDAATAYKCCERYQNDMCQNLPVVAFPAGTKPESIRETKPTLFHAIVAVASGTIRPDLQPKIISDMTRFLADRVIFSGEKSMELVQAIQVMTVFYQPPEKYEELNFNQLIHTAAIMALDIGMGKRSGKAATYHFRRELLDKNKSFPDPRSPETRRCWLGCYYMCSNSAMSLRRPLLVRWSPYADECIEILRSSPDALPSDRWLCHITKAQHIAEKIGTEFAMDDAAIELKLTDPNVQYRLKGLEADLAHWHKECEEFMTHPVMRHTEAIINLYMHEIAMHNEHNIDDFRPPYHSTPIEGPPDPESVTPIHVDSLTKCLRSIHQAFDAFLSMDIPSLRSLPTHFFVRNSYAAVALIKLYTAIAAKESKFGTYFKPQALKVEHYLDNLITTLTKVAEGGMCRVAYKFSLIFQMLRTWHLKRTENPSGRGSREQSQPRIPPKAGGRTPVYNQTPSVQKEQHLTQHQHQQSHQHQTSQQIWQPQIQAQQAPRSGLQMLSEAAMNPAGRSQQVPAPTQGQWMSPPSQAAQVAQSMQIQGGQHMPDLSQGGLPIMIDPMMAATYGMQPDQMGLMDFTSDELMAYGFGDEFMAMNFGLDQGGGWNL